MNKKDFHTEMKKSIEQMSLKELQTCFLKFAAKFSFDRKEEMVEFLEDFLEDRQIEKESQQFVRQMSKQTLEEKMEKMEEWLDLIENEELYLTADGYEEYGYGWEDDWVWEYHDDEEVAEKIMIIIEFAKDCMNTGKYAEAASLFDKLLAMEVWVENEWDDFVMDLEQMEEEELIELDLEEFALMTLYTNYQAQETKNRAEHIYSYFQYHIFQDIHIKDIWEIGKEELKEEETFWKDWIELLTFKEGATEARLLKEAVLYKEGSEGLVKVAEKCYKHHPGLYFDILQEYQKDQDYQKMAEIGARAVQLIDKKFLIRSQIAMKTALAEYHMGNEQEMKRFWYEAYVSDTKELNYLRLFLDEELASSYGKMARNVQETVIKNSNKSEMRKSGELAENQVTDDDRIKNSFIFFFGEFEKAKNACINPKGSLGWSGEFIGLGIKLFLLYFYQGEQLSTAIGEIAKGISETYGFHNNREFYFLTEDDSKQQKDDKNTFWMAFCKWRNYFPMEDAKKESYLLWMEDIIKERTKAIVGGQFRAHYASVACLILALGEVRESMECAGAKQNLQMEYKQMFPRHTAFHAAMRNLMP